MAKMESGSVQGSNVNVPTTTTTGPRSAGVQFREFTKCGIRRISTVVDVSTTIPGTTASKANFLAKLGAKRMEIGGEF